MLIEGFKVFVTMLTTRNPSYIFLVIEPRTDLCRVVRIADRHAHARQMRNISHYYYYQITIYYFYKISIRLDYIFHPSHPLISNHNNC